ncbi:hypothetical protein OH77DRAFT_1023809 [Trametes cingulata]|nr:hypothetical protein OH77DRAFT_1023809 [Trametes cingulata]
MPMQARCSPSDLMIYASPRLGREQTLSREFSRPIRDANGPGTGRMGLARPDPEDGQNSPHRGPYSLFVDAIRQVVGPSREIQPLELRHKLPVRKSWWTGGTLRTHLCPRAVCEPRDHK